MPELWHGERHFAVRPWQNQAAEQAQGAAQAVICPLHPCGKQQQAKPGQSQAQAALLPDTPAPKTDQAQGRHRNSGSEDPEKGGRRLPIGKEQGQNRGRTPQQHAEPGGLEKPDLPLEGSELVHALFPPSLPVQGKKATWREGRIRPWVVRKKPWSRQSSVS